MKLTKKIENFIKLESTGGLILFVSAIIALLWANISPDTYHSFLTEKSTISILGSNPLTLTTEQVVNDVLMTLFFFVVGVELKIEMKEGSLSSLRKTMLPALMALCGFLCPALIYCIVTEFNPSVLNGWAIPTATDIAFALGILSLFGERVPRNLKLLLLALALFYAKHIDLTYLALFFATSALCVVMNKIWKIRNIGIYVFVGMILWCFAFNSGIHSTLAGIVMAFTIPFKGSESSPSSPAKIAQQAALPYSSFLIIPLFTIVNAGVYLMNATSSDFTNQVTVGLALGLIIGKTIGISSSALICFKLNIFKIPNNVTKRMIVAVSTLGGVGFTVALFVGGLSGITPIHYKLGIFIGTIISAIIGMLMLNHELPPAKKTKK